MAAKLNRDLFRKTVADELRLIGSALQGIQICPDASPLQSAASECQDQTEDNWGYNLSGLILRLGKLDQAFPTKKSAISCKINCSVKSTVRASPLFSDPFDHLALSLLFEGEPEGGGERFFQTWHLDREPGLKGNEESDEIHPRYHIHFGGKGMRANANEIRCKSLCYSFGRLLLLPSPRLMHPPLDGVLAIDFVLANTLGATWKSLRKDATYSRIVERCQARIWAPFACALSQHWDFDSAPAKRWLALDACPQLTSDLT